MGVYTPTIDDMVGYGIGACFLDNLGANINDGDCNIVIPESLTVSSLPILTSVASSNDVFVNANVSWTAISNDGWISIDTPSGTGNATVSVTVTENVDVSSRAGTVTFAQIPGGDDIIRVLNVMQEGADLTSLYDLINDVPGGGPVSIHSFSKEEVNGVDKFNYATNTLDKDNGSVWAADDLETILPGDYFADGEYIIYDLGDEYQLDLIQFTTTNKSDPFGIQIWVSTTGTDVSDFSMALPTSGDLLLTATNTTEFNQYEITADARYVKLMGYGRFNSAGDTRTSVWTALGEIEFYGSVSLSLSEVDSQNKILLYPVPAKDLLHIKSLNHSLDKIQVYSLDGRKVIEKIINSTSDEISLDTSSLVSGAYIVNLLKRNRIISKMIIISN